MQKNQKGFSLVELLIVVAIIGIIAAIAIPSLLAARRAANESAAIGSLRSLGSAQATYLSTAGQSGAMTNLIAGQLIDNVWASPSTRNNYTFTESNIGGPTGTFQYQAVPVNTNQGTRSFNIIEDYVVRFLAGTTAPSGTAGTPIGTN